MQLVIIAGGKGTRLGLKHIPKPMVEIAGKPVLEHQIELAKRYGIKDIFILSGHLADVIVDYFKDGSDFGVNITHIIEPKPLGTAGSLKMIEHLIQDRFLVFYGDVVMDFNINKFIEFDAHNNSIGTTLVHPNDHPYDSDLVDVDSSNKVISFLSKPHDPDKYYRNMVNAAVYIFSPDIFKYIEFGTFQDFGKDILPAVVNDNKYALMAYLTPEYIKDMGCGERLERVCQDLLSGKVANLNLTNKQQAVFLSIKELVDKKLYESDNIFSLVNGIKDKIKNINKSELLLIILVDDFIKNQDDFDNLSRLIDSILGQDNLYADAIYPVWDKNMISDIILKAAFDFNINTSSLDIIGINKQVFTDDNN